MDPAARKTALRMISYGLYVLGAEADGARGAATVSWVTQASFEPPLVVLGVKKGNRPYELLTKSRQLALSMLESGQKDLAYSFFKPTDVAGEAEAPTIGGHRFETQLTGAPILLDAPAWLEARVRTIDDSGDHAVVIAEVIGAGARRAPGTPLTTRELGLNYGG